MTKLRFLMVMLYLLGQTHKINSTAYNDQDNMSNDQGLKHTIHTLKGRYNEEVHRLKECGKSLEENVNIVNQKPLVSKKNVPEITEDSDNLPNYRKVLHSTNTPGVDIGDMELTVLSQMLGNMDNPSRQFRSEDGSTNIINNTNQPSVNSSISVLNNSVLDSTEKHFEFESLIIKNEADKRYKNNGQYLDNDTDENNTRRFFPYDGNQGQYPVNYYNPFVNTPAKTYIPPENINLQMNLKQQGNNLNNDNFNKPNPILKNEQTDPIFSAVEVTTSPNDVSSEHNETIQQKQEVNGDTDVDLFSNAQNTSISNEDINSRTSDPTKGFGISDDLFSNGQNITNEDINSRTSDPTKGFGISDMVKSNLMLIEHPRVCYACSSTNNPSCWSPGRWTPTKYCRQDHNACVTKIYKHKGYPFVIRDCGNTCQNRGLTELFIPYQSCTICHSDLCNGAYTVQINFHTIIIMLVVISYFKYST